MAKVTIQDVAREAGVALGTVSNALNHPEKVKASTLQSVRRAMDRLGYAPNQSARLLAGGTASVFGLIVPRFSHALSLQIARGAHNEALRHGYDLCILYSDGDPEQEARHLSYFRGSQVAGILLQSCRPASKVVARAWGEGTPCAYLDMVSDRPGYFVYADNEAQGALIAEHAVSCGARHIAVFGKVDSAQLSNRASGVIYVAEDHPEIRFEFIDEGSPDSARDGYVIGSHLAVRPEESRPDFVIALTDALAAGIVRGLLDAGVEVPGEMLVAGCDGNPLTWTGDLSLTTVAPLGYELGRKGVQALIEQIEVVKLAELTGEEIDRSEVHLKKVRPFLLARESSGGAAGNPDADLDLGCYF